MNVTNKSGYRKSDLVRAQLLDVAEELFARRGFFGVSVRDITDQAEVRNASINYHFGSKEALFTAVIDRRIEPLAEERLARLSSVRIDHKSPKATARRIAEAFAGPMIDFASGDEIGWKNYCILVAQLGVQKLWKDNETSQKYDDHAEAFIAALQKAFPEASSYRIHCAFQFLLSTTLYAVCENERIDTLSGGAFRSSDLVAMREPFLDFVSAGVSDTAKA